MNQPTEERLKKIEEKQADLDKRLREIEGRQTEPIKITRLEIDQGNVQELLVQANKRLEQIIQTQADRGKRLDTLENSQQALQQELHTLSNNWLDSLQENTDEIKQEIVGARSDILALRESQADLRDTLKNTATKDDLTTVATKDD